MVTTGAAPIAAVLKAELESHPEKAMKLGGMALALSMVPGSLSGLIMAGAQDQDKTAIQNMVQKQYYANIQSAVHAKRCWEQTRDADEDR